MTLSKSKHEAFRFWSTNANRTLPFLSFSLEEEEEEEGEVCSKERKIGIFTMAVTIELRENGKFKSADRRDEYGCRVYRGGGRGKKNTTGRDLCDANPATVLFLY